MTMTLDEAIKIANQSERSDLPRGQALQVLAREIEWMKKEITALQARMSDDNR